MVAIIQTEMPYSGAITSGGEPDQNGSGGPASALGQSSPRMPGMKVSIKASAIKPIGMQKKLLGENFGAGKLSKSGATTKSESLARLRGKGALA